MDYQVGQRFELKSHLGYQAPDERSSRYHGDANYEAYLDAHHPIFQGQIGTVEAVVAAEEEGAGNHEEEHVVLSFEARVLTSDDGGNVSHSAVAGHPGRNVSFTQAQMDEMFAAVAVGAIEAAMQPQQQGNQPATPQGA